MILSRLPNLGRDLSTKCRYRHISANMHLQILINLMQKLASKIQHNNHSVGVSDYDYGNTLRCGYLWAECNCSYKNT